MNDFPTRQALLAGIVLGATFVTAAARAAGGGSGSGGSGKPLEEPK